MSSLKKIRRTAKRNKAKLHSAPALNQFEIINLMQDAAKCLQSSHFEKAEALIKQILVQSPDHGDARNFSGIIASKQKNYKKAEKEFRRALKASPSNLSYLNNLGVSLKNQLKLDEAKDCFQRVIKLKPDFAEAYNNLGNIHRNTEYYDNAIESFKKAVEMKPDFSDAHVGLGKAYREKGVLDEAISHLKKAIEINPGYAEAFLEMGYAYTSFGEFEKAAELYNQALSIRPDYGDALFALTRSKKYESSNHDHIDRMTTLLQSTQISENDKICLHFALGKIYDDCREFDQAFGHYQEGNTIKRKSITPDKASQEKLVKSSIRLFTTDFFSAHNGSGSQSDKPIFIVGMPRSGTTLVEQILSSHPHIHGAGETSKIRELSKILSQEPGTKRGYPKCLQDIDPERIRRAARQYEDHISGGAPSDAIRITEKTPANHQHLGLIALLFPNARVIHCKRNPMDTCLSNYFQLFTVGNSFSFDLQEMALHYLHYLKLMAHWRKVLPLSMHEIRYEDLVNNFETEAVKLYDHVGLECKPEYLEFYKNRRSIRTASSWQARQPIYNKSVQRWKNYGKHLSPLKKALGI